METTEAQFTQLEYRGICATMCLTVTLWHVDLMTCRPLSVRPFNSSLCNTLLSLAQPCDKKWFGNFLFLAFNCTLQLTSSVLEKKNVRRLRKLQEETTFVLFELCIKKRSLTGMLKCENIKYCIEYLDNLEYINTFWLLFFFLNSWDYISHPTKPLSYKGSS